MDDLSENLKKDHKGQSHPYLLKQIDREKRSSKVKREIPRSQIYE